MSKVHVVVVAWNGEGLLQSCLSALEAQQGAKHYEVWVVDNASSDNTPEIVKHHAFIMKSKRIPFHVIQSRYNLGYTGGANLGMRAVLETDTDNRDLVVILNQDVEVQEDWLKAMVEINERVEDLGVLGSLLFYPDGKTIQHAGAYLEFPRLTAGHLGYRQVRDPDSFQEREVDFVTGAAIGLRAGVLRRVGLFDETFTPGYYEDADICIRVKREGLRVLFSPKARAKHAETQSFKDLRHRLVLSHRNRLLFALSYYPEKQFDHFFNAEAEYLREHAHPDELRLLSSAYLLALMRWLSLNSSQRQLHPLDSDRMKAILRLREICIQRFVDGETRLEQARQL